MDFDKLVEEFDRKVERPKDLLSEEDILCQLAEEASELAQACLKKVRIIRGKNPTPTSMVEAQDNFIEEIADVFNCINQLDNAYIDENIVFEKEKRWVSRLLNSKTEVR